MEKNVQNPCENSGGWWFAPLKGYKSPKINGRKCFIQLSTIKISGVMSLVFMGAYLRSGD